MDWQDGSDSVGTGYMGFKFDPCDHDLIYFSTPFQPRK